MRYLNVLKRYGAIIVLTLCFFVFFFSLIVGGKVFFCCDNLLINIPAKVFLASELAEGRFPLWNPYILSGMPFLADINLSLLFPTTLLYLALSPFVALTTGVLLSIYFSMVGMYGLISSLTRSRFAGVVGALIWTCSGTMITYTNNVPMLQVLALLPWVAWMLVRYLSQPTPQRFTWLIVALTFSMFGGHPQFIYYTWILVATITLVYAGGPVVDRLVLVGKLFIYSVGLSAVQLLPFAELASLSTRFGRGFEYSSAGSLHPASFVRLLFPTVVGHDASGTSWILGGSINGYIGVLGLLLAFWAPTKEKFVRYFRTVAHLSYLLALGSFTPLFTLAYFVLPGLSFFRSPENSLVLATFSLSVLAGFGARHMRTYVLAPNWTKLWIACLGVMLFISLVAMRLGGVGEKLLVWAWLLPQKVQGKLVALGSSGVTVLWESIWQNVLVTTCLGILFVWLISRKRNIWLSTLVITTLVFVELLVFVSPAMILVRKDQAQEWLGLASQTARRVIGVGGSTIFTDPKSYPYPQPHVFGQPFWPGESSWQAYILRPNIHMMYGLASPDGYSSTVLRSYQQHVSPSSTDPTGVNLSAVPVETLRSLGIGSVVTVQEATSARALNVLPIAGADTLECDACVVHSVVPTGSGELRATLDMDRYTVVQTNIAYFPGWEVTIDGQTTRALDENGLLAVAIPAGRHTIIFRYDSFWVRVGIGMTIITAMALAFHLRPIKSVREQEIQNRKDIQGSKGGNKK